MVGNEASQDDLAIPSASESRRGILTYPSTVQAPHRESTGAQSLVTSEPRHDYGNADREKDTSHGASIAAADDREHPELLHELSKLGSAFDTSASPYPLPKDIDDDANDGSTPESVKKQPVTLPGLLWGALLPDLNNEARRFLPRGRLIELCSFARVYEELRRNLCGLEDARRYAEWICGREEAPTLDNTKSRREIFAILVLIKEVPAIKDCYAFKDICDDDLPFAGNAQKTKLWKRGGNETDHLAFFHDRDDCRSFVSDFYARQWWVHLPYIGLNKDRKAREYVFEASTVLPWISKNPKKIRGGFGSVQQIEIHPDHHGFPHTSSFALKTLHDKTGDVGEVFKQEANAFERFQNASTHLVELCAFFTVGTIKHESQYMLLFPWAEGGSLDDLWSTHPSRSLSPGDENIEFAIWIAKQCHGVASVLDQLHEWVKDDEPMQVEDGYDPRVSLLELRLQFGRHGDIKPNNILYFRQDKTESPYGVLKLADLGLVEFHGRESRSQKMTGVAAASKTYRSPEHDLGAMMSRKVDVWALGCVLSELLTWAICGPSSVRQFASRRMEERTYAGCRTPKGQWNEPNFFFKHEEDCDDIEEERRSFERQTATSPPYGEEKMVARIKPSVSKWFRNLRAVCRVGRQPNFFVEFLDYIEDEMLHPDRLRRATSADVTSFLSKSIQKGDASRKYWSFRAHEESSAGLSGTQEATSANESTGKKKAKRSVRFAETDSEGNRSRDEAD